MQFSFFCVVRIYSLSLHFHGYASFSNHKVEESTARALAAGRISRNLEGMTVLRVEEGNDRCGDIYHVQYAYTTILNVLLLQHRKLIPCIHFGQTFQSTVLPTDF